MAQVERLLAPKPGPATVFLCSGPFSKLIACHTTQHSLLGFPCGSVVKESTCDEGDLGSIPGLARSPGGGKGYPL